MLADVKPAHPATRYRVAAAAGAPVTAGLSPVSEVRDHLRQGAEVLAAEARLDEGGAKRMRISCPGGWIDAASLEPAAPRPRLTLDFDTFAERHLTVAAGDAYGLDFPFTLDMVREFGAEFLTRAFRAAGTISPDNAVTAIVELKPLGIRGASENAFLTVAYAKDEPGLKCELFVKVPPADTHHKYGLLFMSMSEVDFYRFSREVPLPVPVPRYYFGDYSSHTANSLLITERIPLGIAPIEPAYRKGFDQHVPQVRDHYRVLARSIARLACAHKAGALGHEVERTFPFAHAARDFNPIPDVEGQIDRLIDFVGRIAPHLFVEGASDPAFLQRWKDDLLFGYEYKDAVIAYLHRQADYTALCHPNLNIDNAWFWRDEAGELHAGLFDWGGAGQMSIAQALSGMLMMPDPDMHLSLVDDVMATFIDEYARGTGIALDPAELRLQYKASLFSTAMCTILAIVVNILPNIPEEQCKTMADRFDERLQDSGLVACIIWIDNMLREWLEEFTPGDAWRRIVAHG
ncbi:MAG: hypothetical protein PHE36_00200 [Novosphingobium sp.]|nr:hypothetical protein [Novosphingobium sp.]